MWFRRALISCLAVPAVLLSALLYLSPSAMATPKKTAFLGVLFENDNAAYEPTTNAEKARLDKIAAQFTNTLSSTGDFTFVAIGPQLQAKIDGAQTFGACGGCEFDFAREAGAGTVAWIKMQKVSNLILNMNVYIEDAKSRTSIFEHSVDIRGNTDESWSRSLSYLLDNYFLARSSKPPAVGALTEPS